MRPHNSSVRAIEYRRKGAGALFLRKVQRSAWRCLAIRGVSWIGGSDVGEASEDLNAVARDLSAHHLGGTGQTGATDEVPCGCSSILHVD